MSELIPEVTRRPVRPEDVAAVELRGMRLPFGGLPLPEDVPTWSGRSSSFEPGEVEPGDDSFMHEAMAAALRKWAQDPEGRYWAPSGWRLEVVDAGKFDDARRWVVATTERPFPLWRDRPEWAAFRAEVERFKARWAEHPEEAPGAPGPTSV